ncbi:MAG: NADH-quinone oxidoreductase subunit D [Candidatus Omnitrophica bacterium]|nr:NADH-quinone oxidoreductase subunit D [Candidatus Omnitrophota bacterium]
MLSVTLPPDTLRADKDAARHGYACEAVTRRDGLRELCARLKDQGYFLECLTALDFSDAFELVYVFSRTESASRFLTKVVLPKPDASGPGVGDIFPAARWYEREVYDFFGIRFDPHPNLKRLILPETPRIHPLLKSFKGSAVGADAEEVLSAIHEDRAAFDLLNPRTPKNDADSYELNLGPQHPATHGVMRIIARITGERVLSTECTIGYGHRNHEKMAEIQDYRAFWPNLGRLDYVGAMAYNFTYAELIERAMGIEAPARAQTIRVLLTELNRIASHLLWLATFLLDLGAFTPYFYCFDDREKILDITELCTGERLTYNFFRFGGVAHDIPEKRIQNMISDFIPAFRQKLKDYRTLIGKNIIFRKRTQGIGVLSKETALAYGVTGPSLRASGVCRDDRRVTPYSIYPRLDFEIPVRSEGDSYARYLVRMDEMAQSLRIVEQIYRNLPPGEILLPKVPKTVPRGEYYFSTESARGSFGIYLASDGSPTPYRLKLRTPSFSNISAFSELGRECFIADLISIFGSFDAIVSEIDR